MYQFFSYSKQGVFHPSNQDAYAVASLHNNTMLAAVADGISQCPASEVASRYVVCMLPSILMNLQQPGAELTSSDLQWAADKLQSKVRTLGTFYKSEMATTLTGALLCPDGGGLVFWLGDSPAALLREDGTLIPLTYPHNTAALELGLLEQEQKKPSDIGRLAALADVLVRRAPEKAALERFIGGGEDGTDQALVTLSCTGFALSSGDTLLLGSDGLMRYAGELAASDASSLSLEQLVNKLTLLAYAHRESDDQTIIAVRAEA